jgi:uncharacterized protein YjbI with pentapeptide repeats
VSNSDPFQNQSPAAETPEQPDRWTRERLEAAIAENGGPKGLNLAGADLSDLDLTRMDLHGIVLIRWAKENKTHIVANLQGVNLEWANLQGAYLWSVNLQGVNLMFVNLQGACLGHANLQEANLEDAKLQEADMGFANLQGACLGGANLQGAYLDLTNLQEVYLDLANLQKASLGSANLKKANLGQANLQEVYLGRANLQEADLRFADLREVDLLDVEEGGLLGIKIYRAKLDHTALKREQLGPKIGDERAREYREARDAYLALKRNFEDLGDYEAASWSYIKERQMEKATKAPWRCREYYGQEEPFPRPVRGLFGKLWPNIRQWRYGVLPCWSPLVWWFWFKYTLKWGGDWFVEGLCKYGESISRVLFWMAAALLGFAAYYGRIGGVLLVEPNGEIKIATSFWHYLVYSAGAFTTTGFARFQAVDDWVRLVTAIQAIVGIFLAGLLGFVAGNRIRRS